MLAPGSIYPFRSYPREPAAEAPLVCFYLPESRFDTNSERLPGRSPHRMKQAAVAKLKRWARGAKTRLGQKANRVIAGMVASQHTPPAPRIARQSQRWLHRLGYHEQSYKTCLLTEAQCLRAEAAYGPPSPAWAGVRMPLASMLVYQMRRNLYAPFKRILQPLLKLASQRARAQAPSTAGLFEGMAHRFRSATSQTTPSPNYYQQLSEQASSLLSTLQTIQPRTYGQGNIGILISCYKPEEHIDGFLSNLLGLESQNRLVPVVINAGMTEACARKIQSTLANADFFDYHFIDDPGCGIYKAWNLGIDILGNSVEFITNFNVDDRRHPLCLDVQAEYLNAFPHCKVAITDYTFFFEIKRDIVDLYSLNSDNRTLIPVVNERTLVDRNFPHSSPLWRRSLHHKQDCGLFNGDFSVSGDAEFWYRVSRMHSDAFSVISIPLSLYYQNPSGLSTRPDTIGLSEHVRSTMDHYSWLTNKIDDKLSLEFARHHLLPYPPEHIQFQALSSSLEKE